MNRKKDVRLNRTKQVKSPEGPHRCKRAAKYNYSKMEDLTIKASEGFAVRLAQLRNAKGVSGREMSLSIGQAAGYINNIENGNNLPSLAMFFEICEYLGVSPREFFNYTYTKEEAAFANVLLGLSYEDRELLLKLAAKLSNADLFASFTNYD